VEAAGLKDVTSKQAAEQAKFLSDVQGYVAGAGICPGGALEMRDLQLANEQFGSFQQDMVRLLRHAAGGPEAG